MDEQAMLTRDLVLRICASPTEFDHDWLRQDRRITAPFTAERDNALLEAIVAASRTMGVDRLLMCRTRGEFSYEPVTLVPAAVPSIVDVIREWGSEPTDVLVAVEDLSAAVLVTASPLTVAAGPDDFVRAFVGDDIPRARAGFATEARESHDQELIRAAQRYNCIEAGARHARGNRGPGPDPAERVANRARTVRDNAGAAVNAARALRGAWGWAMVAVLLLSLSFVPGLPAAVPVVTGMLWLLLQLAWLARSRTVSVATLLRVLALGALTLWPLALAEQAVARAAGADVGGWLTATYIAVPVEEVGKFAPLLLCKLVARRRYRRFAAVDYLLLAAASGAGFHLAEQGVRAAAGAGFYPAAAHLGVFTLLPGWVDFPADGIRFSGHAVTTGLIGAALGLAIVGRRYYGVWLWLLPAVAVWVASLEHLMANAARSGVEPTATTAALAAMVGNGAATRWLLLALLVAAVLLDYRLARFSADTTPPLPGRVPLARLRSWARGRAVRVAVRIPGDIAPVFRRAALVWARFPVTLATALSAVLHEVAVMLASARQGPETLATAWRFLRHRRAHAMGAARAQERPWRAFPTRDDLSATKERLDAALHRVPAASATAVAAAGAAAVVTLAAGSVLVDGAGGGNVAVAAVAVQEAGQWLQALPGHERLWAAAAAFALVNLFTVGVGVPHTHPALRNVLRSPGSSLSTILGSAAPGQLGYVAAPLLGKILPRGVVRLLGSR